MKKKSFWPILVIIFFCIIVYTYESLQVYDVMSDRVWDTAVVNRIYSVKHSQYFEYQYDDNGIIYHNHLNKTDMRSRNGEFEDWHKVELGDSILIMYKQSEPQKSFPSNILGRKEKRI